MTCQPAQHLRLVQSTKPLEGCKQVQYVISVYCAQVPISSSMAAQFAMATDRPAALRMPVTSTRTNTHEYHHHERIGAHHVLFNRMASERLPHQRSVYVIKVSLERLCPQKKAAQTVGYWEACGRPTAMSAAFHPRNPMATLVLQSQHKQKP
jgi:hypothetical protein